MSGLRSGWFIGLLLAATAGAAQAQSSGYVKQAVEAAVTQAQHASEYSGYGAASGSFCLLGGWIKQGEELTYSMPLHSGKGYLFVGGADHDVGDLDLVVSDGENEVKDTETDNTPWVHVGAQSDCTATIHLQNFHGSGAEDFCVFIVLEEGGAGASGQALVAATTALCQAIDGAHCQTDHGGFCLLGGLMGTGGELGIERDFAEGTYSIVGWGDSHCQDLDLEVKHGGEEVCKDQDTDSTPVGSLTVSEEARLEVTLKMFKSSGNAFGVCAVLKH